MCFGKWWVTFLIRLLSSFILKKIFSCNLFKYIKNILIHSKDLIVKNFSPEGYVTNSSVDLNRMFLYKHTQHHPELWEVTLSVKLKVFVGGHQILVFRTAESFASQLTEYSSVVWNLTVKPKLLSIIKPVTQFEKRT